MPSPMPISNALRDSDDIHCLFPFCDEVAPSYSGIYYHMKNKHEKEFRVA